MSGQRGAAYGLTLVACCAVLMSAAAAQTGGKGPAPLVTAHNASGQMLFRQFTAKPGNIVFSPHSVATAMDMALAGARGTTASQMRSALQHTLPPSQVDAANKALRTQIAANAQDGVKNLSANALMITGATVQNEYQNLLRSQYDAEIFANATLDTVNGWVKEKTEGKIPTILEEVSPGGAVILNAVYFKAGWQFKFNPEQTKPAEFHLSAAQKIEVPTMRQRGSFAHARREEYSALRLPYAGTSIAMVVVRPDRIDGANDVAAKLGGKELAALFNELRGPASGSVDLALPRFRAEFSAGLNAPFKVAGIIEAFAQWANFSGIGGGLFISQIVHKAFIDVTEEGAEAAAATAVVMSKRRSASVEMIKTFHVDRPFLFYIVDMESGAILFQGRIQDPSPKQS